jgi:hypothetical protein
VNKTVFWSGNRDCFDYSLSNQNTFQNIGEFESSGISYYNFIRFDGQSILTDGDTGYLGRSANPVLIGFLNG